MQRGARLSLEKTNRKDLENNREDPKPPTAIRDPRNRGGSKGLENDSEGFEAAGGGGKETVARYEEAVRNADIFAVALRKMRAGES